MKHFYFRVVTFEMNSGDIRKQELLVQLILDPLLNLSFETYGFQERVYKKSNHVIWWCRIISCIAILYS